MKHAIALAIVVATSTFAICPASSMDAPCSGAHLAKMTTMVGSMPEGPHRRMMNKHLEIVNSAMAKDGMRGCETAMRSMHRHHAHNMHGHHMHGEMKHMRHSKAM